MDIKTLAIVGGGANGVATFIHLVLKLIVEPVPYKTSLLLVEKDREFGPGLAYGTEQNGHLLNTAANLMGIFAEEPLHFVEWLQENEQLVLERYPEIKMEPTAYLPRRLYGEYLKAVLHAHVALARRHGLEVNLLQDEAVNLIFSDEGITLQLKATGMVDAVAVVLATGTPKPNNFPHLRTSPNYIDFPWPGKRLLEKIPQDADVSILGASLTAIDTLVTFLDNGHRGKLALYSRHGLLPRVQTPFDVPHEPKELTLANIRKLIREKKRTLRAKDLFRLFRQEAERELGEQQDWKQFNRVDQPHLELLKYDVDVALAGESTFQNIAFSTRHLSNEVWKLLPEDQKLLFSKWFGPHWDINRHSMPLQNAYKLIRMLESGQLTVKPHSDKVEWMEEENTFHLHLQNGTTDQAPYLINATGTARNVEKMEIPLLQALLQKDLIVPHKAGGLRADPHTLQVIVPAFPQAPLYGVGQLLSGELFDTNSVWFNVACIDRMTNDILRRLSSYGCTK